MHSAHQKFHGFRMIDRIPGSDNLMACRLQLLGRVFQRSSHRGSRAYNAIVPQDGDLQLRFTLCWSPGYWETFWIHQPRLGIYHGLGIECDILQTLRHRTIYTHNCFLACQSGTTILRGESSERRPKGKDACTSCWDAKTPALLLCQMRYRSQLTWSHTISVPTPKTLPPKVIRADSPPLLPPDVNFRFRGFTVRPNTLFTDSAYTE